MDGCNRTSQEGVANRSFHNCCQHFLPDAAIASPFSYAPSASVANMKHNREISANSRYLLIYPGPQSEAKTIARLGGACA